MKKIISLIAAVSMLFALSTSAFAYTADDAVVTGATLSGKTITYDPANTDGFTFAIKATADAKMASYKIVVSGLQDAGWTISPVDGTYSEGPGTNDLKGANVSASLGTNMAGLGIAGLNVVKFKATPGAGATIDGVTFTVGGTVMPMSGAAYNTMAAPVTYTLAKAAAQEKKTTATIGANGEVTFDYADADAADAKLAGKKVVLGTAYAGNLITADTTVKVTYTPVEGAAETKTFGETLFEKLDVEGFGFLETESITFGIVCDTAMTGTFSFALN